MRKDYYPYIADRNAIHRTELIMRMVSEFATAKNEKEVIDEQH